MTSPSIAVVVLNWNGKTLLQQFIPQWIEQTEAYPECELIIVDNGSTDGSAEWLKICWPKVKSVFYKKNLGFAEGYNQILGTLKHPIVVLLNSDAILLKGWLDEPLRIFNQNPDIVAIQPKIKAFYEPKKFEYAGAAGGYLDLFGYPYCQGRVFDFVETDQGQYNQQKDILWASGACLMIRRQTFCDIGGFDPLFFAHQEEIDLCWRIRSSGGRIVYVPQSEVLHMGATSLSASNPKKTYLNFRNNLLMLYKNMPMQSLGWRLIVRLIFDLVAALHFAIQGKRQHTLAIFRAYRDAWELRNKFRLARQQTLNRATALPHQFLTKRSIVIDYFLLGRKTYREIHRL